MELKEGTYTIPPHLKAIVVKGDKVIVSKRLRPYPLEGVRCRTCAFFKKGAYAFSPNQYWEATYCSARPKTLKAKGTWWYATQATKKACELYKEKTSALGGIPSATK